MVKFKDFSRLSSVFQVLLRQILFSRTLQDSPVYSSTFQACANPVHMMNKSHGCIVFAHILQIVRVYFLHYL